MAVRIKNKSIDDMWEDGIQNMDCDLYQKEMFRRAMEFVAACGMECTMMVDKWPNPSVILYRPSPTGYFDYSKFSAMTYVLSSSEEATRKVLENCGKQCLQHDKMFSFFTSFPIHPIIRDISEPYALRTVDVYHNKVAIYKVLKEDIPIRLFTLKERYSRAKLEIDNARLISKMWSKVKGSCHNELEDLEYIEYLIMNNLSIGIKDSNGSLVAWCLQHPHGPLGFMFVLEGHRGQGIGSYMLLIMTNKVAKRHGYAMSEVLEGDEMCIKMHEKCGFQPIEHEGEAMQMVTPLLMVDKAYHIESDEDRNPSPEVEGLTASLHSLKVPSAGQGLRTRHLTPSPQGLFVPHSDRRASCFY